MQNRQKALLGILLARPEETGTNKIQLRGKMAETWCEKLDYAYNELL